MESLKDHEGRQQKIEECKAEVAGHEWKIATGLVQFMRCKFNLKSSCIDKEMRIL